MQVGREHEVLIKFPSISSVEHVSFAVVIDTARLSFATNPDGSVKFRSYSPFGDARYIVGFEQGRTDKILVSVTDYNLNPGINPELIGITLVPVSTGSSNVTLTEVYYVQSGSPFNSGDYTFAVTVV